MFDFPVAVISDIHGNRWALEAVLQDIRRREIYAIVNLGDILYGPLDPSCTAQILVELDIPTVLGNQDRILIEPPNEDRSHTLEFVLGALNQDHLKWLNRLEMTLVVYEDLFLCHGSPDRDDEYLLMGVSETGVSLKKSDELMAKLSLIRQQVILCGHDHIPRSVILPDDKLIINPGSVGLPAYTDDLPFSHTMETGTPHARYSIVSKEEAGWSVENIAVPYDWETASEVALQNGRLDWAAWLRTGRAG